MHDDTFVELFRQFWWLIFPLAWIVLRLVRTFRHQSAQDRALEVLRIYAAQGREPPPEVLKALTQTGSPSTDVLGGPLYQQHVNSPASAWWTFFVFIALTGGFAVGASNFSNEAHGAFMVVTVVMAILAFGALVMALSATFFRRK